MACKVVSAPMTMFDGREVPEERPPVGEPRELCRALSRAIDGVEAPQAPPAAAAELRRRLAQAHGALEGSAACVGKEANSYDVREKGRQLLSGLLLADAPARLIACLGQLGFEERKAAMRLFSDLLRWAPSLGADEPVAGYFARHPTIAELLLEGCGNPGLFAYCAEMVRDCARYPELVRAMLEQGALRLVNLARDENFEISTEAFATLRALLLEQQDVAVEYLLADFEAFFPHFHASLLSEETDYVVKRQASKLLADVLLCRAFGKVMVTYVADERFLQIHMISLRDKSRSIQLGAFHIFKVFAANPSKPRKVHSILHKNKGGLLRLLGAFAAEAAQDAVLAQDLAAVVAVIESLEPLPKKRQLASGA